MEKRGGVATKRKIKKNFPNGQRKKRTGAQTATFAAQTDTLLKRFHYQYVSDYLSSALLLGSPAPFFYNVI